MHLASRLVTRTVVFLFSVFSSPLLQTHLGSLERSILNHWSRHCWVLRKIYPQSLVQTLLGPSERSPQSLVQTLLGSQKDLSSVTGPDTVGSLRKSILNHWPRHCWVLRKIYPPSLVQTLLGPSERSILNHWPRHSWVPYKDLSSITGPDTVGSLRKIYPQSLAQTLLGSLQRSILSQWPRHCWVLRKIYPQSLVQTLLGPSENLSTIIGPDTVWL
jgi:MFS superfamily sulfate permease-like transporter